MIQFTINGPPHSTDAPPDTPLLWVIREGLKLTGTKFGCGAGLCGACMVHIDHTRAFSCQTPIRDITGRSVTTIEGGIVYGLGLALSERITIKDGIVEQSNFYDYQVPRMKRHRSCILSWSRATIIQLAWDNVDPACRPGYRQCRGATDWPQAAGATYVA